MISRKITENKHARIAPPSLRIEVDLSGGVASLLIYGAIGVSSVSGEFIAILTKGGRVSVSGAYLSVASLELGVLEVSGNIMNIGFGKGALLYDKS